MVTGEVLVVLADDRDVATLPGRVVAQVPPRVAVLRLDGVPAEERDAAVDRLRAVADHLLRRRQDGGVDEHGDRSVLAQLDDGARLFVSAWRRSTRKEDRVGDALAWDAPGFEPPDHGGG